jgi:peptidoglycan hydrolase-like protein with peptidoglycan-binding domain
MKEVKKYYFQNSNGDLVELDYVTYLEYLAEGLDVTVVTEKVPDNKTNTNTSTTKKTTPKTTVGTQCASYSVCSTGTLKKCCKDSGASRTNPDTNGIIYKLQGVIGAGQDGYFGPKTEKALKDLRKTTTITVDDANKLISANNLVISATTKTPEEQKTFFDGLIKDKYIRDGNLLQINTPQITALDGRTIYSYAYVKKFEAVRDKNGNLISVGNVLVAPKSTEVIYSDDTLIVFFFYDYFWAFLDKEGIDDTNKNLRWNKGKAQITFGDLSEQKVDFSSILGKSSGESNTIDGLNIGGGSSSVIQKSEYGTSDDKSKTDEKTTDDETATKKKFDSVDFCKSAANRQDQLRCMFGFINDEGVTFSPKVKIETMNVDNSRGIAGEGSLQYIIDEYAARSNYFDDYNELMELEGLSDSKLKYPDDYTKQDYAGQIIDDENYSGLVPLEGEAANQFSEFTFGKFLATNSTLKVYLMQSGRQAVENIPAACADKPEVVRERLKRYLASAFLGTRKSKTDYENLTYLNRCLATNVVNDKNFIPFTREDFTNVTDEKLPFNLLRKELKLSDIKRLIRGQVVGGIQLKTQFVDEYFATDKAVYESLNTNVKRHITEAIKTKEKVKIKNRIITEILLEMKR